MLLELFCDIIFIKVMLAAFVFALVATPVGSFVVWNRLAWLGDTIAHSSLAGLALAYATGLPPYLGLVFFALSLAIFLSYFISVNTNAVGLILTIISHGSLGIGIVIISISNVPLGLEQLFLGDILAVSNLDIMILFLLFICLIIFLYCNWWNLLNLTVNFEVAQVEGVKVDRLRFILMLFLTLITAFSIQIVGILLLTVNYILGNFAVQRLVKSPLQMVIAAGAFNIVMLFIGITLSFLFDAPTTALVSTTGVGMLILLKSFTFKR